MGRKRSERTGGIWHMHPQQGELVQAETEFFKEELMSSKPHEAAKNQGQTGSFE
ncbi:hypothetical protein [Pseudomonas sp. TCU-HL1]|uniref:hypothetical protein n=1 Tax=Pseudomonas sp. TCU-HL1 TaxID=1856685 RepID=UPI000856D33D|nr:hypothetical protein [Pseudomonas sp. TCU-HL1]AOE84328.1 urea amidolyase [Pseudomonas sp. TCU-HL1]